MNLTIKADGFNKLSLRLGTASARMRASTTTFMATMAKLMAYSVQEKEPIGMTRQLHDSTVAVDYGSSLQVITLSPWVDYGPFIEKGERSDPRVAAGIVYRGGAQMSMAQRHWTGRVRKNRMGRYIAQAGGVWMFRQTAQEFAGVIGPAVRDFQANLAQTILGA